MKRFIYILLSLLVLNACSQELQLDEGQVKNSIVLNINNSTLETKALVPGTPNENKIETLDCFFYTANAAENTAAVYYAHFDPDVTKQAKVYLYLTENEFRTIFPNNSTSCKVYVIANLTLPEGQALPANSTIAQLKGIEIEAAEFEFVVADNDTHALNPPQKFVMHGEGNATVSNGSASGDIELIRAASKVTLNLKVPEYIEVDVIGNEGTVLRTERWEPNFENVTDPTEMEVSFHNGLKNGLLDSEAEVSEPDHFETFKANSFTLKETVTNDEGVKMNIFSCDAIFYSYSKEWDQGDVNAPYFNLVVPWERVKSTVVDDNDTETKAGEITGLHPYYYQVQINPVYRKLESNHWYDLTLNIGVLGSTIEAKPELITDCTFYVIDWSHIDTIHEGDYEEIHLSEWRYFIVNETRIEMNNISTGYLPFKASHNIDWKLEWPTDPDIVAELDNLEKKYNDKTGEKNAAYYINSSSANATAESLSAYITKGSFELTDSGLRFNCPEATLKGLKVYSPVYVHLKVWLNIDNDTSNEPNSAEEKKYVEYITFVYYPAIYVIPDPSTRRSVYVNGVKHTASSDNGHNVTYGSHKLGNSSGIRNDTYANTDYSMYILNVTSFDDSWSFPGPTFNADGSVRTPVGQYIKNDYKYIIGDPRDRTSEIELDYDNDDDNMAESYYNYNGKDWQWRTPAYHIINDSGDIRYEENHRLQFYYPTSSSANAFQVISPRFRVVSFNNASRQLATAKGAAMRCATLQEDGFPAGRWRLPTVAEVQFIIQLQEDEAIQAIFSSGSNSKYATALYTDNNRNNLVALNENNGLQWTTPADGISVRCVYDDWYWGSEREAKRNDEWNGTLTTNQDDEYFFTWGDKEIIW